MSAGIASCYTPCAGAPASQQQPATTGGGAPTKGAEGGGAVAPASVDGTAPAPVPGEASPVAGSQPAATGEAATVGGGGSTCYQQPAPQPAQCGQWVPAPVATGDVPPGVTPAPSGDTPPEPIAGPTDAANLPSATAPAGELPPSTPVPATTTPAAQLPTWPEWQQHFERLGLQPSEVAKIAAAPLTDAQLAKVYEDIHGGIVTSGGVPGETRPEAQATTTWGPAWEQRFLALGLPAEFVAELRTQAQRTGAGDAQLERVYQQLVEQLSGGAAPGPQGPQPTPGQPAPDQQQGPGWNPHVEQAFRTLGMPDEVLKLYAESGAPLSGLEAAHRHASARVEDFRSRGWWDRFTEAKVPPLEMWSLILGDQPAKDEDLQKHLDAHRKGQRSLWQKGGQLATSLFPGGRLAQYIWGREALSKDKIDRTSPMEIGMAALSGLALFAAFRGARTIGAGWAARGGGYAQLNGVNGTLGKLGLPATGTAAMTDTAMGATQTWGFRQKLLSMIPGTALHREVVGLGHAEAAARAFNGGGAAKLLQDPDGALQVATLAQMFDDIKSGATRLRGGANAYMGPFRKAAPMAFDAKRGHEVINVAKNLRIGNGNSQLVSLMEVGGRRLGTQPEWLRGAADLVDDVQRLAKVEREALGGIMAGNAARNLGNFSRDGSRPLKYLAGLGRASQPEWYTRLAASTASQWPGGQLAPDLLDVLTGHRIYGQIFDEGAAAIRALDRTNLPEGVAPLLDDATSAMDEARTALDAAKAAGSADEATLAAINRFGERVSKIHAHDAELAARLFPTYVDESLFVRAQVEALDAIRASHAAARGGATAAAAAGDEVASAVAGAGDAAASVVDDAIARAGASPSSSGATSSVADAVDGAGISAPTAPVATPGRPVELGLNARGEAVTPSGLVVPSYTAPASGLAPADATPADIRRLQSAMERMRRGA